MCDCGCNTCDTKSTLMLNESLAPRAILSEGLKYHMDANKPLTEHLYRAGSDNYFNLWAEARSLYSRNILEITHEDDLAVLTETDLGHFGMFEGKKVPLDFPMLVESYYTAIADLGGKKTKENLDSFEEVQDFMDKMIKRNAISVEVTKFSQEGKSQTLKYDWDGEKWLKVSKEEVNEEGGEDDRKYALLKVAPRNYEDMIDKLQDMNINHTRHSGTEGVIKVYTDRIPDKVLYRLTHDVWVDKFVLKEAKKNNKKLNKPMRDSSGGKAYKVYVKDPKTKKIKTVRFGSGGLRAKINDKKARNAFAKRHNCSAKKDKTKAGYWSCRLPRYASLLGLKSSFSGFW